MVENRAFDIEDIFRQRGVLRRRRNNEVEEAIEYLRERLSPPEFELVANLTMNEKLYLHTIWVHAEYRKILQTNQKWYNLFSMVLVETEFRVWPPKDPTNNNLSDKEWTRFRRIVNNWEASKLLAPSIKDIVVSDNENKLFMNPDFQIGQALCYRILRKTLATREKISQAQKVNWEDPAYRTRMTEISKARFIRSNPESMALFRGRHHTPKARERIREANLGRRRPQYDKDKIRETRIKYYADKKSYQQALTETVSFGD